MSQMNSTLTRPSSKKNSTAIRHHKGGSFAGKTLSSGIVNYCIHGQAGKINDVSLASPQIIGAIKVGLPIQELRDLQASLDVQMENLYPILGISKATFHRRQVEGRLDQAESDRVVRFAKLMGKAIKVLESEENARKWLNSPQFGLGGAVPLQYAETELGAREVENLLGRIEYGVYS
jgi:putative toxin-antitoxin system antitoxin component (TIGR02293 family)